MFDSGVTPEQMPACLSTMNSAERNNTLIREAVDDWRRDHDRRHGRDVAAQPARTAAICQPFDIIRDIPSEFADTEVVSKVFPSRPAGRLGFQYLPSINLSAVLGATTVFTEAQQLAVDPANPATWKPIVDVPCPTVRNVIAEAVPGALRFDNTTEMSNPEVVRNYMDALAAQRARNKEGRLLQRIDGGSSLYTARPGYGAVPALIETINTMVAQAIYINRLDEPRYVVLIDPLTIRALLNDRANRAYADEDDGASSDLLTYINSCLDGVDDVIATLDGSYATQPGLPPLPLNPPGDAGSTPPGGTLGGVAQGAAVAMPGLPGIHRVRIVAPDAAIYAETGEMYVGVMRSPDLLRQNKAQFFAEEYFMLAKHGPAPWFSIDLEFCSDGARAGFLNPTRCGQT